MCSEISSRVNYCYSKYLVLFCLWTCTHLHYQYLVRSAVVWLNYRHYSTFRLWSPLQDLDFLWQIYLRVFQGWKNCQLSVLLGVHAWLWMSCRCFIDEHKQWPCSVCNLSQQGISTSWQDQNLSDVSCINSSHHKITSALMGQSFHFLLLCCLHYLFHYHLRYYCFNLYHSFLLGSCLPGIQENADSLVWSQLVFKIFYTDGQGCYLRLLACEHFKW